MSNKQTYRELRNELDKIVTMLQESDLDVDEATELYQKGMKLVTDLETRLKVSEAKIKKVKAQFERE